MDHTDNRIVTLLGEDGRMSNREIARRIGISEGTVRQRLAKLMESGTVRITAQVNIESFPDMYLAFVGMKIDGRHLKDGAAAVGSLPSVITTMIVTGRYDLLAVILVESHKTLVELITNQLGHLPGVRDSETFVVLKNYDQWIPANTMGNIADTNDEFGG